MNRQVFLSGVLLLVLALPVYGQEENALPQPNDLSSPRAAIRTFFEAMSGVQAGNDNRLIEAIECIFVGEDLSDEERVTAASARAERLFEVLDRIQFDLDEIPESVDGRSYTAVLGKGENEVQLRLYRYDDGRWRFSSQTVDEESLEELAERVVESSEGEPPEDRYVEHYRSPRATMQTFLRGMNETDGMTQADAIGALHLDHLPEVTRLEKGRDFAIQLKAIIDRIKVVEYSELPPESDGPPFVFFRSPDGKVAIEPVEDEDSGKLAWRFNLETVEGLEEMYLTFKDRPTVHGLEDAAPKLSWSLQVRDWMFDHAPFLLHRTVYLQNYQWLGLFLIILGGMIISRIIGYILILLIRRWLNQERAGLNQDLETDFVRPVRIALMAWFWFLGLSVLGLPAEALVWLRIAAQVVSALGGVWAAYRLIDIVGEVMAQRAARSDNKFDDLLVPIITRSLKVFVVVVGIVVVARGAGQNPTSIFAGLGLGGLAFALAAKDVVANIFGSFTILLDRPFQIGDWVKIGDIDGNVEAVGIRSTRVRTFYNSLITVPNSELINQSVDNMGERRYRRIKTMISIAYDTPPEKIEAFCEGIRELIRQHPYTRKDYYHCYFNEFGASSLDILLYCFVETPEWGTELRERHRLFNDIVRLAARLGIEFAFPTRTLYLRQEETPRHEGPADARAAERLGRREALDILRGTIGLGAVPPPVDYGPPPEGEEPIDDRQTGDEGDGV